MALVALAHGALAAGPSLIHRWSFNGDYADSVGGADFTGTDNSSSVTFINDNTARGAMRLTVSGCTLDANTSGGNGGGIYTRAGIAEIRERVTRILKLVELSDMEQRMTNQLSGGQQQRVALARALVVEPGVLLFDEPLSNLDAKLRVQMRTEIRRIQQALGITAIYVTHDQSEAMAISDNIILMKNGVIAQMGSPTEISEIVLRPEAIEIADRGQIPCKVELSCFMGSYQNYHVRVGDTLVKIADNCPIGRKTFQVGDDAFISFRSECAHLLET